MISAGVGILSGLASALFLVNLSWVTSFREAHRDLFWGLPLAGIMIGLGYHYYGKEIVKGNNLILEEYENPQKTIPFKMAPMIFLSTLLTHLVGGSAGREGTAIQLGSTLADQFTKFVTLSKHERKILLLLGISAGFASVFGTPIAGALFAIEVLWFSNVSYKSIFLSFTTAFFAYFTVSFMPVVHTHYAVVPLAHEHISWLAWALVFGVICGLIALLFSKTVHLFSTQFTKYIPYPPLRPVIGGVTLVLFFYLSNEYKYAGLGIPTIVDSFKIPSGFFDCILKLILTCFTLGCGFKGGEVTPLFFIGATLGSSVSGFIPMPISLLAAMGFVAVFSGATHTPIACTAMGMELFGWENGIYIAIACFFSYLFSGTKGIYRSQQLKGLKSRFILKYL